MSVIDVPSLWTLEEVAKRLHLSRRTVERMVAAELLPVIRVGPRTLRVDPNTLEEWLADSTVGGSFPDSSAAESGMGRRSSTVEGPAERRAPEESPAVEAPAHAGQRDRP
jgi:excisionase family DNA binding protein